MNSGNENADWPTFDTDAGQVVFKNSRYFLAPSDELVESMRAYFSWLVQEELAAAQEEVDEENQSARERYIEELDRFNEARHLLEEDDWVHIRPRVPVKKVVEFSAKTVEERMQAIGSLWPLEAIGVLGQKAYAVVFWHRGGENLVLDREAVYPEAPDFNPALALGASPQLIHWIVTDGSIYGDESVSLGPVPSYVFAKGESVRNPVLLRVSPDGEIYWAQTQEDAACHFNALSRYLRVADLRRDACKVNRVPNGLAEIEFRKTRDATVDEMIASREDAMRAGNIPLANKIGEHIEVMRSGKNPKDFEIPVVVVGVTKYQMQRSVAYQIAALSERIKEVDRYSQYDWSAGG